jgi:hypothetical protein
VSRVVVVCLETIAPLGDDPLSGRTLRLPERSGPRRTSSF